MQKFNLESLDICILNTKIDDDIYTMDEDIVIAQRTSEGYKEICGFYKPDRIFPEVVPFHDTCLNKDGSIILPFIGFLEPLKESISLEERLRMTKEGVTLDEVQSYLDDYVKKVREEEATLC